MTSLSNMWVLRPNKPLQRAGRDIEVFQRHLRPAAERWRYAARHVVQSRVPSFSAISCAVILVIGNLTGCSGEPGELSPGEKALAELQAKYDELTSKEPNDAVEWAAEDIENFGDWEYLVLELPVDSAVGLEKELNAHGNERWEAFWVEPTDGGIRILLKRPAKSYLSKLPLSAIGKLVIDGNSE